MSVYLDTSVVVALFVESDAFTACARQYVGMTGDNLIVSDFIVAEFASAMARLTRMERLAREHATALFADLDAWISQVGETVGTTAFDVAGATSTLRRLDLNLRTPDAVHIAIASCPGATLATFDARMANAARTLGLHVALA